LKENLTVGEREQSSLRLHRATLRGVLDFALKPMHYPALDQSLFEGLGQSQSWKSGIHCILGDSEQDLKQLPSFFRNMMRFPRRINVLTGDIPGTRSTYFLSGLII
jgi:hypothetical protein